VSWPADKVVDATPLLGPRYQASSLLRVAPPLCTVPVLSPSWFGPLVTFPVGAYAPAPPPYDRFPCSAPVPELRSCHLYAGHRLVGIQAPSRLLPGWICDPGFDVIVHDFDASAVVHSRSSPQLTPNAVSLRLSVSLTTMALDHSRIRRFEASTCLAASEGLPPSRVQLSRRTRSVRAALPHTALTLDAWRQSVHSETDAGYAGWESSGRSAPGIAASSCGSSDCGGTAAAARGG
jgi:hypothetical protein